jgi:hypothetical protein
MEFCHIAPTQYLKPLNIDGYKHHLLLAHLVEGDDEYAKFYKTNKHHYCTYILDNSAFELYRRGLPMFDGNKMIDLGKKVQADYLVLPDYPGERGAKTIKAALEFGPQFKDSGFKTFFVPQSRVGDLEDYIATFAWAASSPLVDYIGMSILGIPNAFGVDGNDIQRYTARVHMFNELMGRRLLDLAKKNGKKIHCLGMTDGPNEIVLLNGYIHLNYIDSWDSSAAIWAGIEGYGFDNSPTGLIDGKVKSHVDFDSKVQQHKIPLIKSNMAYIDTLVAQTNSERLCKS